MINSVVIQDIKESFHHIVFQQYFGKEVAVQECISFDWQSLKMYIFWVTVTQNVCLLSDSHRNVCLLSDSHSKCINFEWHSLKMYVFWVTVTRMFVFWLTLIISGLYWDTFFWIFLDNYFCCQYFYVNPILFFH